MSVNVIGSETNIFSVSGTASRRPVPSRPVILAAAAGPAAETADPRVLRNMVKRQDAFNSAGAYVRGGTVVLKAESATDAGIAIQLNEANEGILSFTHSGSASDGWSDRSVTIQFIKAESIDYTKDKILKQEEIVPGEEVKAEAIQMPAGTNKIVIIKTGKGSVDLKMENVIILPNVRKEAVSAPAVEVSKPQAQGFTDSEVAELKVAAAPVEQKPEPLYPLISRQDTFNSAEGYMSGRTGELVLRAGDRASDPGIALNLKQPVTGKLVFEHSTTAETAAPVTVQFIKAESSREYRSDRLLSQVSVTPKKDPAKALLDIPEGTNKIVVLKVGKGPVDVKMTGIGIQAE
jgi:hypothetical protein